MPTASRWVRYYSSKCELLGGLLLLNAACSTTTAPSLPDGPPLVVGSVFSRDTSTAAPLVLVVVATVRDAVPECGAQFALSNKTKVIRIDGSRGMVRDITVGSRVRVWPA